MSGNSLSSARDQELDQPSSPVTVAKRIQSLNSKAAFEAQAKKERLQQKGATPSPKRLTSQLSCTKDLDAPSSGGYTKAAPTGHPVQTDGPRADCTIPPPMDAPLSAATTGQHAQTNGQIDDKPMPPNVASSFLAAASVHPDTTDGWSTQSPFAPPLPPPSVIKPPLTDETHMGLHPTHSVPEDSHHQPREPALCGTPSIMPATERSGSQRSETMQCVFPAPHPPRPVAATPGPQKAPDASTDRKPVAGMPLKGRGGAKIVWPEHGPPRLPICPVQKRTLVQAGNGAPQADAVSNLRYAGLVHTGLCKWELHARGLPA
ncbi:hypothetical protein WJX84_001518 [Apatococcus fuscideae]|uniref:Uncharacterized protein n=1 Tax=Apatococcus fuscideae TaxID=2026836 RepID=A0AAW1TED4_9CHLO